MSYCRVCIAEPLKKGRDLLLNNEEREVLGEWLQKRSFANVIVILSRTADDDDRTSENKIEEKACLKKKYFRREKSSLKCDFDKNIYNVRKVSNASYF